MTPHPASVVQGWWADQLATGMMRIADRAEERGAVHPLVGGWTVEEVLQREYSDRSRFTVPTHQPSRLAPT